MPTRTRDKLDEANFFFARIRESPTDQRVPFLYYFSAMVSAGRSVTFVMQDEFSPVPGFTDWYGEMQEKMKQDDLMVFMNDIRVENVHKALVRPRARVSIPVGAGRALIEAELEVPGGQPGIVQFAGFERTVTAPPDTKVDWILSLAPLGKGESEADREAITASEQWIAKLEALVDECERKFLAP
jgi:hypothetical protein